MMSLTSKVLAGVVLVLIVALSVTLLYARREHAESLSYAQSLALTQDQLKQANESLRKQAVVADITEAVVTTAVEKTKATTKKTQETVKKVDTITKQVANETISSADADAAYVDSMWEAYCQAKPMADKCSSRQPVN